MGSKQIRKDIEAKTRQVASIEKRLANWREQMRANDNAADAANSLMQDAVRAAALADSDDGAAITKAEAKVRAATEKAERDAQVLGSMVAVAEKEAAKLRAEIARLDAEANRAAREFVLAGLREKLEELKPGLLAFLATEEALSSLELGSEIHGADLLGIFDRARGRLYTSAAPADRDQMMVDFAADARQALKDLLAEEARQ